MLALSRATNRDIPIRIVYTAEEDVEIAKAQIAFANRVFGSAARVRAVEWVKLSPDETLSVLGAEQAKYANHPLIADKEAWKQDPASSQLDLTSGFGPDGKYAYASLELKKLVNDYGATRCPTVFIVPSKEIDLLNPSAQHNYTAGLTIDRHALGVLIHESVILVKDSLAPEVLAHELGHVAGLPHVKDESNIMYSSTAKPGTSFSNEQLEQLTTYTKEFTGRGRNRHYREN